MPWYKTKVNLDKQKRFMLISKCVKRKLNLITIPAEPKILGEFGLLKLKTCWLYNENFLLQKCNDIYNQVADAHFASKNTLLKTHTLLLKSLTHFAAKNTWQSHTLLHSTPCSLTPFATQNPLLLITPYSLTPFATQSPLLLITPCSSTPFATQSTLLLITPCSLTPFATQNPLLLITPCPSTLFASQHPLHPGALYKVTIYSSAHLAP